MERDFAWDSIADKMMSTYEWVLSSMPDSRIPAWIDWPESNHP